MKALEWVDRTTGLFAHVIPPMKIGMESEWILWADHARLFHPEVPNAHQFTDWRLWADRFNQVMDSVKL